MGRKECPHVFRSAIFFEAILGPRDLSAEACTFCKTRDTVDVDDFNQMLVSFDTIPETRLSQKQGKLRQLTSREMPLAYNA